LELSLNIVLEAAEGFNGILMRESTRFCKGTSTRAGKSGTKAEGQQDLEDLLEDKLERERSVLELKYKAEYKDKTVEYLTDIAKALDLKFTSDWKWFDLYYAVIYAKADKDIEKIEAMGTRGTLNENRNTHRAFRQVRRGIERLALEMFNINFKLHGQLTDGFAHVK
jgi:hypothetical protein